MLQQTYVHMNKQYNIANIEFRDVGRYTLHIRCISLVIKAIGEGLSPIFPSASSSSYTHAPKRRNS